MLHLQCYFSHKNFKDSKTAMAKLVDYLEMEVEGDRDGRGEW